MLSWDKSKVASFQGVLGTKFQSDIRKDLQWGKETGQQQRQIITKADDKT